MGTVTLKNDDRFRLLRLSHIPIKEHMPVSLTTSPFLTADWRYLILLNYEVDPQILLPYLPAFTELDTFQDKTFVSMVGFLFAKTRVLGVPVPFHRTFEEVNLRFYVRYRHGSELRRGVVFIREIVPRKAIAFVARAIYEEPYIALPMQHQIDFNVSDPTEPRYVSYSWKFDHRWNFLSVKIASTYYELLKNSEQEFIAEHYWGYTKRKDGSTSQYKVEHPPWRIWDVEEPVLDCDITSLYGSEFDSCLSRTPSSAFLAEGSAIAVYGAETISDKPNGKP